MSDQELYIGTWSQFALEYNNSTTKELQIPKNPSYGKILASGKIAFSCENWASSSALVSIFDPMSKTKTDIDSVFGNGLKSALFVDSYKDHLLVAFGARSGGGFAAVNLGDNTLAWSQVIPSVSSGLTSHQFSVFELGTANTPYAFATSLAENKVYGGAWDSSNFSSLTDLNLDFDTGSGPRHMALVNESGNSYLCVVTETSAQLYLYKITMNGTTPTFTLADKQYIAQGQNTPIGNLTGGAILSSDGNIYVTLRAGDGTTLKMNMDGVYQFKVGKDSLDRSNTVLNSDELGYTPNGLSLCDSNLYIVNRNTKDSIVESSNNLVSHLIKIPLNEGNLTSTVSLVTTGDDGVSFTWVGGAECQSN